MLWLQLALLVLVSIVQAGNAADIAEKDCAKLCVQKGGVCIKDSGVCNGRQILKNCKGGAPCKCCKKSKRKGSKRVLKKNSDAKQGSGKGRKSKDKNENDGNKRPKGKQSNKKNKGKKNKSKDALSDGQSVPAKSGKRKNNGSSKKKNKKNGKKNKTRKNGSGKGKDKACDIKCANDECVDNERKCDKVNDCGKNDDTDEQGCKFVPKLTCHRCKTWDTGDTGAIYDPDCGKADYSNHVDSADDADPYIGCAIKVYKNGDVVRLFESWQTNATMGQCYEGTDYKNGGLEYQYTRCWCSSSNCNTNLCEDCSKK